MDTKNEDITLPPDTLAILQEFLENKKLQESVGLNSGSFEEDWVYIFLSIFIGMNN